MSALSTFLSSMISEATGSNSGISMRPSIGRSDSVEGLGQALNREFDAIKSQISEPSLDPVLQRGTERITVDDIPNAFRVIDKNFRLIDQKFKRLDESVRHNVTLMEYNKRLIENVAASINDLKKEDSRKRFSDIENKLEGKGATTGNLSVDMLNKVVDRRIATLLAGRNSGGMGGALGGLGGGAGGAVVEAVKDVALLNLLRTAGGFAVTKVLPLAAAGTALYTAYKAGEEVFKKKQAQDFAASIGLFLQDAAKSSSRYRQDPHPEATNSWKWGWYRHLNALSPSKNVPYVPFKEYEGPIPTPDELMRKKGYTMAPGFERLPNPGNIKFLDTNPEYLIGPNGPLGIPSGKYNTPDQFKRLPMVGYLPTVAGRPDYIGKNNYRVYDPRMLGRGYPYWPSMVNGRPDYVSDNLWPIWQQGMLGRGYPNFPSMVNGRPDHIGGNNIPPWQLGLLGRSSQYGTIVSGRPDHVGNYNWPSFLPGMMGRGYPNWPSMVNGRPDHAGNYNWPTMLSGMLGRGLPYYGSMVSGRPDHVGNYNWPSFLPGMMGRGYPNFPSMVSGRPDHVGNYNWPTMLSSMYGRALPYYGSMVSGRPDHVGNYNWPSFLPGMMGRGYPNFPSMVSGRPDHIGGNSWPTWQQGMIGRGYPNFPSMVSGRPDHVGNYNWPTFNVGMMGRNGQVSPLMPPPLLGGMYNDGSYWGNLGRGLPIEDTLKDIESKIYFIKQKIDMIKHPRRIFNGPNKDPRMMGRGLPIPDSLGDIDARIYFLNKGIEMARGRQSARRSQVSSISNGGYGEYGYMNASYVTSSNQSYEEDHDRLKRASGKGSVVGAVDTFDLSTTLFRSRAATKMELYSNDFLFLSSKNNLVLQAPNIMLLGNIKTGTSVSAGSTGMVQNASYTMDSRSPFGVSGGGSYGGSMGVGSSGSYGGGYGGGAGGYTGGSAAPLSLGASEENARKAFEFFKSKGWTDEQAAGIVGNLMQESSMNPGIVGDQGAAYGLAQWHADRQQNFAQVFGHPIQQSTFDEQLQFIQWELENTHKAAGAQLKSAKTATEAAYAVSGSYEVPSPAYANNATRAGYAETLVAGKGSPSGGVTPSGGGSGVIGTPAAGAVTSGVSKITGPTGVNLMDFNKVPIGSSPGSTSRSFGGNRKGKYHTGVDIPAQPGTPIRATMDGVIRRIDGSDAAGYGYVLDVEYPDGTVQRYAHLGTNGGGHGSAFASGLKLGDKVTAGQVIGYSGYSGNADSGFPHVHYEIIKKDYYDAYHGRPPGRASSLADLERGRIDPRDYWKSIESNNEKFASNGKSWQEMAMANVEASKKTATQTPPTNPTPSGRTRAPAKRQAAAPNTHDGVNMSPSELPVWSSSIVA